MTSHTLSSAIRYQRLPDFHTSPTAASMVNVITNSASNVMRRKICLILVDVVFAAVIPVGCGLVLMFVVRKGQGDCQ